MLHNDGGAPTDLSGPIILCGRSTNDTVRAYNGRITHLALFDQAITPLEAYAIYNQVITNWPNVCSSHSQYVLIQRKNCSGGWM